MMAQPTMEKLIGIILLVGIGLAIVFVFIGGALYLWQFGGQSLQTELLQADAYQAHPTSIWQLALSFTPLGIIELGLIILVATQIMRVALLTFFYIRVRDVWFTLISLFILTTLLYSFFWRD